MGFSLFSLCHPLLMRPAFWCGLLVTFSPAHLDQSPLIWRYHENNCSGQTGRMEIVPAVIFNQLCLASRDAGIYRKNVLWLTVTVHDLEFISKFLRIKESMKCINNINQAFQHHVSSYQVTYQRSFSADVSLLWERFVCDLFFCWQTNARKPTREHFLLQWPII